MNTSCSSQLGWWLEPGTCSKVAAGASCLGLEAPGAQGKTCLCHPFCHQVTSKFKRWKISALGRQFFAFLEGLKERFACFSSEPFADAEMFLQDFVSFAGCQ